MAEKSYQDAEKNFQKLMGDPRALNRYLAIAMIALTVVCGLVVLQSMKVMSQQKEKIVIGIDSFGKAMAVGYTNQKYKISEKETKYFLMQFVHDYYGRVRATVAKDYPESMFFLSQKMADEKKEEDRKTRAIEKFIVGSDDETEIQVDNIVLSDLATQPYTAQVFIDKITYDRSHNETGRKRFIEGITFLVLEPGDVKNESVPYNPLGFTITNLREDQAF